MNILLYLTDTSFGNDIRSLLEIIFFPMCLNDNIDLICCSYAVFVIIPELF